MKTRKNQSSTAYPLSNQKVSTGYPQRRKPERMLPRLALAFRTAAAMVVALGAVISSAATQITCQGTVTIVPILNSFEVSEDGTQTALSFGFTGTHPLCFPDGSQVTATIAGHMVQHLSDNGLTLRFDETLSYGGDSLEFRGEASLVGSNWESHVQSVGQGTGKLAGVSAQGSFFPTADPSVLTDVLFYVFH